MLDLIPFYFIILTLYFLYDFYLNQKIQTRLIIIENIVQDIKELQEDPSYEPEEEIEEVEEETEKEVEEEVGEEVGEEEEKVEEKPVNNTITRSKYLESTFCYMFNDGSTLLKKTGQKELFYIPRVHKIKDLGYPLEEIGGKYQLNNRSGHYYVFPDHKEASIIEVLKRYDINVRAFEE